MAQRRVVCAELQQKKRRFVWGKTISFAAMNFLSAKKNFCFKILPESVHYNFQLFIDNSCDIKYGLRYFCRRSPRSFGLSELKIQRQCASEHCSNSQKRAHYSPSLFPLCRERAPDPPLPSVAVRVSFDFLQSKRLRKSANIRLSIPNFPRIFSLMQFLSLSLASVSTSVRAPLLLLAMWLQMLPLQRSPPSTR